MPFKCNLQRYTEAQLTDERNASLMMGDEKADLGDERKRVTQVEVNVATLRGLTEAAALIEKQGEELAEKVKEFVEYRKAKAMYLSGKAASGKEGCEVGLCTLNQVDP